MEGVNSSDNLLVSDGLGEDNDQEQEVIVIPIRNRTQSSEEGYTTENGVTVISFDKSKHERTIGNLVFGVVSCNSSMVPEG